jgi:hypothetical protein
MKYDDQCQESKKKGVMYFLVSPPNQTGHILFWHLRDAQHELGNAKGCSGLKTIMHQINPREFT